MATVSEDSGPSFSWKVWAVGTAIIFVFGLVPGMFIRPFNMEMLLIDAAIFLPGSALIMAFYYGVYIIVRRGMHASKRITRAAEKLQEDIEHDFFNNLVKINFKYIDKYYLQTQIQADKSFLMSAFAGFAGLAIIVVGIVMMYAGRTEPAYVTTAAGLISEFIAAVFFYLYNETVLRMAEYHRKLVLTQNVGLAMRIVQDMPGEAKLEAQRQLVDRLTSEINVLLAEPERTGL